MDITEQQVRDAIEVLEAIVDEDSFTASRPLRRSLNDTAENLAWLSRQSDFVAQLSPTPTSEVVGTVEVKTIGDMRRFLTNFPAEADGYPFLVTMPEQDVFPSVEAFVSTNCDDHPDYATIVVQFASPEPEPVPEPAPEIGFELARLEALLDGARTNDDRQVLGGQLNSELRRVYRSIRDTDTKAQYGERCDALTKRVLQEIFEFSPKEAADLVAEQWQGAKSS